MSKELYYLDEIVINLRAAAWFRLLSGVSRTSSCVESSVSWGTWKSAVLRSNLIN